MEIGQRLKKIRKDKGITRAALAKQIDMSQTHLYRLEVGDQVPTLPVIERISSALGVPLKVVFEEEEEYSVSKEADVIARRVVEMLRYEGESTVPLGEVERPSKLENTTTEYVQRFELKPDHLAELPPFSEAAQSLEIGEKYESVYVRLLTAEQHVETDENGERRIGIYHPSRYVVRLAKDVPVLVALIEQLPDGSSERQDLRTRTTEIMERVGALLERERADAAAVQAQLEESHQRVQELVGVA